MQEAQSPLADFELDSEALELPRNGSGDLERTGEPQREYVPDEEIDKAFLTQRVKRLENRMTRLEREFRAEQARPLTPAAGPDGNAAAAPTAGARARGAMPSVGPRHHSGR